MDREVLDTTPSTIKDEDAALPVILANKRDLPRRVNSEYRRLRPKMCTFEIKLPFPSSRLT